MDVSLEATASLGAALDHLHTKEACFVELVAKLWHNEPCEGREPRHEGVG